MVFNSNTMKKYILIIMLLGCISSFFIFSLLSGCSDSPTEITSTPIVDDTYIAMSPSIPRIRYSQITSVEGSYLDGIATITLYATVSDVNYISTIEIHNGFHDEGETWRQLSGDELQGRNTWRLTHGRREITVIFYSYPYSGIQTSRLYTGRNWQVTESTPEDIDTPDTPDTPNTPPPNTPIIPNPPPPNTPNTPPPVVTTPPIQIDTSTPKTNYLPLHNHIRYEIHNDETSGIVWGTKDSYVDGEVEIDDTNNQGSTTQLRWHYHDFLNNASHIEYWIRQIKSSNPNYTDRQVRAALDRLLAHYPTESHRRIYHKHLDIQSINRTDKDE